MKKRLIIALSVSVGMFTACTTTTPDVNTSEKVNPEVKVSDKVTDTAVNIAKGAAVSAATKKIKDMSSKKKK